MVWYIGLVWSRMVCGPVWNGNVWCGAVCGSKALRSAGGIRRPLRPPRKEKYHKIYEADRGPRLVVGAQWRLDNAKCPAAMIRENSPDATCILF